MKITFWGGTESVTGSMSVITTANQKVLVDCGMFQGLHEIEEKNDIPFSFNPEDVSAVLLTHAHLDHCGLLPKLVKEGFRGKILATKGTIDLAKIVMKDAASISDKYFSEEDVTKTIHLFKVVKFNETVQLDDIGIKFIPAGHILGASSVKVSAEGKNVIFSGDIGRSDDHLLESPEQCPEVDLVVMEATYGDRSREGNLYKEFHSFLVDISRNKKIGLIASFAIARGQLLLSVISEFFERHPEDSFPVYVDSPMMLEACKIYSIHAQETKKSTELVDAMKKFEHLEHARQWDSVKKKSGPLLILSSSGMMTGGRVLRHFINLHERKDTILYLPGYQGEGTLGKRLLEGERTVNVNDTQITWNGEVLGSSSFSSHADQGELLKWAAQNNKICLIHGEEQAKKKLQAEMEIAGKSVKIPARGESITL